MLRATVASAQSRPRKKKEEQCLYRFKESVAVMSVTFSVLSNTKQTANNSSACVLNFPYKLVTTVHTEDILFSSFGGPVQFWLLANLGIITLPM